MLLIGSNAIKDGVTIDLRQMRNTTLSADKKTASVQPGSKWGEVYSTLDALEAAIPGGRATDVGAAGLTLGGGNSFFAARYGFVCDNVKNFEIVLGNGTVTNANARENTDLFKGLKGGTGNLGLVTRFDFVAFPSGPLWGGIATYNFTNMHKFYKPIADFANNVANQPYGSLIATWTNNGTAKTTTIGNIYDYTGNATEKHYFTHTDPATSHNPLPKPFDGLAFDKVGIPTANTLRVDSLFNLTNELNSPDGIRNVYSAINFKADATVVAKVDSIIQQSLHDYLSGAKPAPYSFAQVQYQPLPRIFTNHSIERGGNVLGLDRQTDNSLLLCFLFIWDDPKQDSFIQEKILAPTLERVTNYTKSVGAYHDWQYVNYAFADQDPLGSYGEKNINFLKEVSKKYDPAQVFQKLSPGGWKLGDAGKRRKQFTFNQFVAESGQN